MIYFYVYNLYQTKTKQDIVFLVYRSPILIKHVFWMNLTKIQVKFANNTLPKNSDITKYGPLYRHAYVLTMLGTMDTGLLVCKTVTRLVCKLSLCMRKPQFEFQTRSDTNRLVQLQQMARSLKFWMEEEVPLYYPCSETKDADQLCSYCTADLRLWFCIGKLFVFSAFFDEGSNVKSV